MLYLNKTKTSLGGKSQLNFKYFLKLNETFFKFAIRFNYLNRYKIKNLLLQLFLGPITFQIKTPLLQENLINVALKKDLFIIFNTIF